MNSCVLLLSVVLCPPVGLSNGSNEALQAPSAFEENSRDEETLQAMEARYSMAGGSRKTSMDRDGFIQSVRGRAPEELKEIRQSNRKNLRKVTLPQYDAIKACIAQNIAALELLSEQEKNTDSHRIKHLSDNIRLAKEGFARFQRIHESGHLLSFKAIVHHTEDYALAYGNDKEIGVAEELLEEPLEVLSELLLHEATCFQHDHWTAQTMTKLIFPGRASQPLRSALRNLIDRIARSKDGIDPFQHFETILGSKADVRSLYVDEGMAHSPQEFKKRWEIIPDGVGVVLLAGVFDVMHDRVGVLSNPEEQAMREKFRILISKDEGVVGVRGIPPDIQEKIKSLASGSPKQHFFANAWTCLVGIQMARWGYAAGLTMLENDWKGETALCSYAQFRDVMALFVEHMHKTDQKSPNDTTATESFYAEGDEISAFLSFLPRDLLKAYIREIILEKGIEPESLTRALGRVMKEASRHTPEMSLWEWVWEMYMRGDNTPQSNSRLRDFIVTAMNGRHYGWKSFSANIQSILEQKDRISTQKALDVLLRVHIHSMNIDSLCSLLSVTHDRQEALAAYCLLHLMLFGLERVDRKVLHGFIFDPHNPIPMTLQPQSRPIYFYVRKMQEARMRSGASNYAADRKINKATIALDRHASFPGDHGKSWFTGLRKQIHNTASSHDLNTVRNALYYWKALDASIAQGLLPDDLLSTVKTEIGLEATRRYSLLLNGFIRHLHAQGKIRSLAQDHFLDELRGIPGEQILDALYATGIKAMIAECKGVKDRESRKAIRLEIRDSATTLREMIRLYLALVERYDVLESTILPKITGEGDEAMVKKLQDTTRFMARDYDALLAAMKRGDVRESLRRLVQCRLRIKEHLLSGKIKSDNYEADNAIKKPLLDLDFNLVLLGKEWMAQILETMHACRDAEDLKAQMDALALMGHFLAASGLGGVEFEQFLAELEKGALKASQLHDLARALRMEVHKIMRKIDVEMRFVMRHVWDKTDYGELSTEWKSRVKTVEKMDEYGKEYPEITEEGKSETESAIVDDLIKDSALLVLDEALIRFNDILETRLHPGADAVMRPESAETSAALREPFFRFGHPEVLPRPRLLSLWSKKGLNLVTMTEYGIPVPPGVIVSARLMARPDILHSKEFKARVREEIAVIQKFSPYPDLKFLLYARSGSAFMMPGLLTTIPHLGMNDAEAQDLAQKTGDTWFAYDTYAEFIRAFATSVLGIPEEHFQEVLNVHEKDNLTGDQMRQVVERYKEIVKRHGKGRVLPKRMMDQVMMAMDAVYASWDSPAARADRARNKISQEWGSVVILQKGIFGNITEKQGRLSGAGHAVLRTLPDGTPVVHGKFRIRGMGHDLMSRAMNYILLSNSQRHPGDAVPARTLEEEYPAIYRDILDQGLRLKQVFGHDPAFELAVELGKLWITQSNDDYAIVDYPELDDAKTTEALGRGYGVSGGAFRGWVAGSIPKAEDLLEKFRREKPAGVDGVILFLPRVNPEMIGLLPSGIAICAHLISVHAETLAQKSGMPAIYGVSNMRYREDEKAWYIGAHKMEDGALISIDGHENQLVYPHSGKIFAGGVPLKPSKPGRLKPVQDIAGDRVDAERRIAQML